MGTPCKVILFFLVSMYSVLDLVVRTLPTNNLATSSVASRISHMAFNLQANTLAMMFKAFRASSIISLLMAINILVFISVVNRKMVLVVTTYIIDGTVISSFPEI